MNHKIWLSSPHMGGDERNYVQDAFDTNWIAPVGPHIEAFEHDIASYIGDGVHVAALQSGTASLHLALKLCGVEKGDEVLCQSLTFSASANPILYQNAVPVFVDSERHTWNICVDTLERCIKQRIASGKKPAAMIIVHIYGMPANMDELTGLSTRYGIPLIEDAAEAFGSKYNGKCAGAFGHFSVLSFNGNKIITTSGGGALVSRDEKLVQRAKFYATQARDKAPHYEHSEIGYNYRLSNVCAAIGRGQMKVLDERVKQRRKNFEFYRQHLQHLNIAFQEEPGEEYFSNRWLTVILLQDRDTRDRIMKKLASLNIESRPVWKPMHLQPVFRGYQYFGGSVSQDLFERGLCLPSGSNLTQQELELVCSTITLSI